jgi:RNA polymerase sigma-70 factor (ECF subfamily)
MECIIGELYDDYSGKLTGFARSLCKDWDLADELVQETFTRAISHVNLLSTMPKYKIQSWLFSVLKNAFIDIKRKEKQIVPLDDEWDIPDNGTTGTGIETISLLKDLPKPMRKVIFGKFWLDMNSAELGQAFSIPAGTIRYQLHTGLERVRKQMTL